MIELGFAVSVFVAGILMFLAPCTLPLVPAYLAFISGVSAEPGHTSLRERQAIVQNGIAFVLGFSVVFVLFGVVLGLFGTYLAPYRLLLSQLGGALIIFFGLTMLGLIRIPALSHDRRISTLQFVTPGRSSSSFIVGAAFAFGWTPCVGPILASVLLLASTQGTALTGGALLAIFALGLAVPFVLTAALYGYAYRAILRFGWLSRYVSYVGGVLLIVLGVLLATGTFGLTNEYGYRAFDFLNYDRLLDYL